MSAYQELFDAQRAEATTRRRRLEAFRTEVRADALHEGADALQALTDGVVTMSGRRVTDVDVMADCLRLVAAGEITSAPGAGDRKYLANLVRSFIPSAPEGEADEAVAYAMRLAAEAVERGRR